MATATKHTAAVRQRHGGPFDLDDERAYRRWREAKLRRYPARAADITVPVHDAWRVSVGERRALGALLAKTNVAVVRLPPDHPLDQTLVRALGSQLGLRRLDRNPQAGEDGVSLLSARDEAGGPEFIPYTRRALSWHTDGYYNTAARQVRGLIMFCVEPAATGGDNALLDPELAYLWLRDHDPALVAALMHPRAMTIPAHEQDGRVLRPARSGPVFSVDERGALHMRYTARRHSVAWRDDAQTRSAVAFLQGILSDEGLPHRFRYTLRAGEGIVCNNVLHNRSAFEDDAAEGRVRRMYRARYYERVDVGVAA
ncbi:TauD/TfdA family dioxygenase [Ectothiorhodospiraceae bacterium 2226]|nr:TauD/TfdA family dioxygenase [Ectothiorhodospiraceae bacterium 2226]